MTDVVAEAWRTASLATDLRAFLDGLTGALRNPVCRRITLWHLDMAGRSITAGGTTEVPADSVPLADAEARRVHAWLRHGRLAVVRSTDRPEAPVTTLL